MSLEVLSKPCSRCLEVLPLDAFTHQRNGKYGRYSMCRPCVAERHRRTRAAQMASDGGRDRERARQNAHRRRYPEKRLLLSARARAKERGMDFDLTADDIVIPDVCPILGIPLTAGEGNRSGSSPSLDRVDSSKGYVRGNVRVISWRANKLKGDATLDELRAIVRYVEASSTRLVCRCN